ncbi:hypothetical protein D3C85_1510160 [compost metagenome]
MTLARVTLETPAPPYSLGTLMPHRPEREKTSSSGCGKRRSRSRRALSRLKSSARSLATIRACSSLVMTATE